ncbi:MAG TPA: hypothetical protein VKR52_03255 [Terracidiphilus sp.]|nr:hypothetical protein [Terracidiphilus sp.]
MLARMLRIAIAAALLLTGYMVGTHSSFTIHAQTMKGTVPSSYGRLAAADSSSLWFEDDAGTLRQVTIPAGNTIFVMTRH